MARFIVRQARNGRANNPHRNWIVEDAWAGVRLVFNDHHRAVEQASLWARNNVICPHFLLGVQHITRRWWPPNDANIEALFDGR